MECINNKMKPLVSFVIPVHDNSLFEIQRCIGSIKKIKNLMYEILVIDNNSSMQNSKLYKKLSKENNINYFYTGEQGVGKARNIGITKAKGEYLSFVDADDEIVPDFLDNLTFNKRIDLYIFNIVVKNAKTTNILKIVTDNNNYIREKELAYNLVTGFSLNNSVGKLFRRKFLINNNIFFTNMRSGEDATFIRDIIIMKPSTRYVGKNAYVYYEGATNSRERLIKEPIEVYNDSKKIFMLKKTLAERLNINTEVVLYKINQEYIKGISNNLLDLWNINNKKANLVKELILKDIKPFNCNKNYSYMTNIRIQLLKSKSKILINLFNYVRNLYLKMYKN